MLYRKENGFFLEIEKFTGKCMAENICLPGFRILGYGVESSFLKPRSDCKAVS